MTSSNLSSEPGTDKVTSALTVQVGGDHYKKCGIQPVEYIHSNKLDFFQGSVIKYITRWRDKGGVKDLRKVQHFIDLYIEQMVKDGSLPPEALTK